MSPPPENENARQIRTARRRSLRPRPTASPNTSSTAFSTAALVTPASLCLAAAASSDPTAMSAPPFSGSSAAPDLPFPPNLPLSSDTSAAAAVSVSRGAPFSAPAPDDTAHSATNARISSFSSSLLARAKAVRGSNPAARAAALTENVRAKHSANSRSSLVRNS